MNRWLWGVLLILLLVTPCALAQTCTASSSNIALGSFSSVSPAGASVSGNINISCTGFAQPYVRACVSIGLPANGGTWSARSLPGPSGSTLLWTLYQDAGFTRVWTSYADQGGVNTNYIDMPLSSGAANGVLPYYARVPGNQGSNAGAYSLNFSTNDTLVNYVGFSSNPPACANAAPFASGGRFSFTVSATVTSDCLIAASNIDFGQVGVISSPVNSTGTISATCTNFSPYNLLLGPGQGAGANQNARKLTRVGDSDTLGYALYTDATRSIVWGDGTDGTNTRPGYGSGTTQTSTIYATLLPSAAVPAGVYVDTVIATVMF